jgi:uncharacterized protein YfdQ (DUF2303 family)
MSAPVLHLPDQTVMSMVNLGSAISAPRCADEPGSRPFVVVPDGFHVVTLEAELRANQPGPPASLEDAVSFARYFQDHGSAGSRIYADAARRRFEAVFDDYSTERVFAFRSWRAWYAAKFSDEWIHWKTNAGKPMAQAEFAQFVEDAMPDIDSPDGSQLMEMVLSMELSSTGKFASSQRLQDGSKSLTWRNETNQVGTLLLPESMSLLVPIFKHQAPLVVQAKLRFRLSGEKLSLHYDLVRPARAEDQAFELLIAEVASGCTLDGQPSPVLRGVP